LSRISSNTTKEEKTSLNKRTTEEEESGSQDRMNPTHPASAYMEHEVDETSELSNMSGSDLGKDYIEHLIKKRKRSFLSLGKERT
jgi:hypothetical protein